jgi:ribosomal protein S18 acetylase RimI-like enzyme
MSQPTPVPLRPVPVEIDSEEFRTICGWPFLEAFVGRILREDIPQRVFLNGCRVWVYYGPDGELAGFGTIEVCEDYSSYTDGQPHAYLPLLAANPTIPSRGYGTSIVRHLIGEAALMALRWPGCRDVLFLDVYTTSVRAIELYDRCGFESLMPEPIADPDDPGKSYLVMARRVSEV